MIHNVFSIYDQAADAYLPPFVLPRVEMAKRTFEQCINSKDHQFNLAPQDYTLFLLGNWDDETGRYSLRESNTSLGNGIEFLRPELADSPEELTNGKAHQSPSRQQHDSSVLASPTSEDST